MWTMSEAAGPKPRIVALGEDDVDAILELDGWAFGVDDEVDPGPTVACFEWDRTRGAYLPDLDGIEQLAGIDSVYSLDLPVPGGSLACAGLTWVGVHPAFRRRGVLTALITDHLQTVRERGEAVSALHASEATIYGRFGYGAATAEVRGTLPRGAALRDVPGADTVRLRMDVADVDRHSDVVGDCYEAARRSRPGMVSRNSPAQRRRRLFDPTQWRSGAERLRILIAEAEDISDDGQDAGNAGHRAEATIGTPTARGYALFRRQSKWEGKIPDGTVLVKELVARDPATARALWGRLLDLDLMARVETDVRATDDALLHLLVDPRQAKPVLYEGLWVRLIDLPTALAARRYNCEVDVVFDVRDELCPWNAGRWRLSAGPEHARCSPSAGSLDSVAFSLDVRELGAAFLGSRTLNAFADAGLAAVLDPVGFATASRAFSWPVAAHCGWMF
jgi:predicted acetyltransferase